MPYPVHTSAVFQTPKPRAVGDPDILVEEVTETRESIDMPWNVIIHNDPINLMEYVTKVIMRVFGYPLERAERHMMEVHKSGRSVVWSGERERAEFFVQQLHSFLLLATIERSE